MEELCEVAYAEILVDMSIRVSRKVNRRKCTPEDFRYVYLANWWYEQTMDKRRPNLYPSKAVRQQMCKESGLTMIQLNNWFGNVRRRGYSRQKF